jgi:prepilin-type N-terminal cleavage/methylation domain-containing protein
MKELQMKKVVEKSKQRGFTLVELGIVLALIGIGLFFAISKINETGEVSRAQNVSNDISTLITNVKRYYSTTAGFPAGNFPVDDLRNNGVFPGGWVNGTTVTPPFGGTLGLERDGTDTNSANLTIPGVPSRVCSELGRLMANGATRIQVGTTEVKGLNGQLNLGTLGTACTGAAAVEMIFRFTRA